MGAWLPRVKCLVSWASRVKLPCQLAVKNAETVVRSVYQLTVGCQVLTGRQLHMRRFALDAAPSIPTMEG